MKRENDCCYDGEKYPLMIRFFHLLIALIIFYMLTSGIIVSNFKTGFNMQLTSLHKQCGILLTPLICFRLLTRFCYHDKLPNLHMKILRVEVVFALFVQVMLYIVPLLMSISGYIMSYSGGRYVSIFGFQIPSFVKEDKAISGFFYGIHVNVAIVLIVLISFHILGALKHLVTDKRNIVKSMFS